MDKNKIMNISSNVALAISILVGISFADGADATLSDIGTGFIVLVFGIFIYIQKLFYNQQNIAEDK